MTTKTNEKTTITKVEITPELIRVVSESLISAEWFYREEDGSITDEDGDPIKFEKIQRAVEHWFRLLINDVVNDPEWHMPGKSGWPTFDTRITCREYWCSEKPIDGSHWCQFHFEEAQDDQHPLTKEGFTSAVLKTLPKSLEAETT